MAPGTVAVEELLSRFQFRRRFGRRAGGALGTVTGEEKGCKNDEPGGQRFHKDSGEEPYHTESMPRCQTRSARHIGQRGAVLKVKINRFPGGRLDSPRSPR